MAFVPSSRVTAISTVCLYQNIQRMPWRRPSTRLWLLIGYIALLIALSNPVLLFGLAITKKHGMNGPASGFFEEWQAEHIRSLIPERNRDVLVALAEADPGVVSIRDYFYSLPDLTAEQFQEQIEDFDNQTKESDQVRGEPQGRAITIPLGPSSYGHS